MGDDMYFGFTTDQWQAMVEAGLLQLEALARHRGTTDYTGFCAEIRDRVGAGPEPGDHALQYLLGDVGRSSFDERGVVVTALVHYRNQGPMPGPGFYTLCEELRLLPEGSSEEARELFFGAHCEAVFAAYRRRRS